ncbi:MAG: DUF2891 domain-containing protein [Sphingomicrobium sp.]
MRLDSDLAARMAAIALGHVTREYPHKLDHVLLVDEDARPPRELHPVFFGSFDWHSCVHGWWTLLTLHRLGPDERIAELADATFTADKIRVELDYLGRELSGTFERPCGWAWLLYLQLEATRHKAAWSAELEPLARACAGRLRHYLEILTYPIRVGTHFNTAFALILSLEWAQQFDAALAKDVRERVRDWFGDDRDCQAWEPGGDEFLSPALIEALAMKRSHPALFPIWFDQFLPRLASREPATLFTPAIVSDRSDGKIAHLDGLNLSRAWCWRELGYPEHGEVHLAAAMPHLSGDYMGEHWLASFALLALLTGTD